MSLSKSGSGDSFFEPLLLNVHQKRNMNILLFALGERFNWNPDCRYTFVRTSSDDIC